MSISAVEFQIPLARSVRVTSDTLHVDLSDGRTISVPVAWYPRLAHGTQEERRHWRLIGQGRGIHWGLLDEDISVVALIAGKASGESQSSFKRWLGARASRPSRRPAVAGRNGSGRRR